MFCQPLRVHMRELTPMQAAGWVGREAGDVLGRVVSHLYAEFDGPAVEPERLRRALERLGCVHRMLHLRVDGDGRQSVEPTPAPLALDVEDLSDLDEPMVAARLAAKRRIWTHRRLDLASGQAAAFGLSLLPGRLSRLHVDTDMIAVDPVSFRIVMEDLARFYEACEGEDPAEVAQFFEWLDTANSDPDLKRRRERDRLWWRSRLADIPPAPPLPTVEKAGEVNSDRLAVRLSAEERHSLLQTARRLRVTTATLMLSLFAFTLGRATGAGRFRLSVPTFFRQPVVERVDRIVGDFSNLLVVGVELRPEDCLATLASRLGEEMIGLLAHCAYPGVSVMRDLSRHRGSVQTSPVVFTAGLDLSGGELFSARVSRVFGQMNWTVSQGPQVAIDAQVAAADGGLLINWDIRFDALPKEWVTALFDGFVALVRRVADAPDAVDLPLSGLPAPKGAELRKAEPFLQGDTMKHPLNALQQAYLLGRSEHLPLGGVAMQEFREYRGHVDFDALPRRLAEMVGRHESLRTRIDTLRLQETVSGGRTVNYRLIDLGDLACEDALRRVEALRDDYAHGIFDLDGPPWDVTAFRLPQAPVPGGDTGVVFIRFDALIVDGRAIAALMVELFGDAPPDDIARSDAPVAEPPAATIREADAAYWAKKLAGVEGPPQLPWLKPIETVKSSRYGRESLTVERERFAALARVGARQRLFKNSMLTAVILEVLSRWVSEGGLCVGIPVAPQSAGPLGNRSSFIAVHWDRRSGTFAERSERLQADVLEGLEHLAFSGVDISRLLMAAHPGNIALPVVITNGLSWPVLSPDRSVRLSSGLTQTPQVAMDIRFSQDGAGHLILDVDYAREAIDTFVVRAFLDAMDRAITAIVERGALALSAQDFITLHHYHRNGAVSDFACDPFLERVAGNLFDGHGGKTALISGSRRVSYAELGEMVSRAMAGLKAWGIGQGSVVAVCLGRSPEHTAVTLAAALVGAIWVPIDAGSPADRLAYLLENCRPDLIVATMVPEGFSAIAPERLLEAERPDDPRALTLPLDALSASEEPAYYLYTSGTTGKPKCVVLANRATANVIGSTLREWSVTEQDVFISVTPLHHDMSVFDVLGCLTAGATLVLPAPGEEKDAIRWNQLVAEHGVTLWCSVPAILEMLLSCRRGDELGSLRLVAQGGDYIKPAVIAELRRLKPDLRLISLGGPTETTIWSIWHEIGPEDTDQVPYGHPLPANRYFLLDDAGEHCPTGVVGRIHTAGVNVAIGYLEGGVLSQTDFVTVIDEAGNPVRAFRTGDRGRYRPDGKILFAGRVNGYVKVRGVRVSLPDIENELVGHPAIRRVLVVDYGAEQSGEAAIGVLYVADPEAGLTASELRAFARRHLPESHVPTRLIAVDDLPLSANGKPDRRRARELMTLASASEAPAGASQAATRRTTATKDRRVLDIYLGVLGRPGSPDVDETTDFLALGLLPSHLKAISTRIRNELGVELALPQLVRCRNAGQVQALLPSGPS